MWTRKTRCEFVSHLDRFDTECRTSHKRTCELVCRIRLDFLTSLAKFWSYKMISLQQRKILRILQKERGRTNSHCWAIVDMQRKELEDSKTIAAGYQRRWRNKVWEKIFPKKFTNIRNLLVLLLLILTTRKIPP